MNLTPYSALTVKKMSVNEHFKCQRGTVALIFGTLFAQIIEIYVEFPSPSPAYRFCLRHKEKKIDKNSSEVFKLDPFPSWPPAGFRRYKCVFQLYTMILKIDGSAPLSVIIRRCQVGAGRESYVDKGYFSYVKKFLGFIRLWIKWGQIGFKSSIFVAHSSRYVKTIAFLRHHVCFYF